MIPSRLIPSTKRKPPIVLACSRRSVDSGWGCRAIANSEQRANLQTRPEEGVGAEREVTLLNTALRVLISRARSF